jgi:hypothetical protein
LERNGVSPPVAALIEKLFNRFRTTDDWVHAALTLPDMAESVRDREHAVSALCRRLERNALVRKAASRVENQLRRVVTVVSAAVAIVITVCVFSRPALLPDYWFWLYYPLMMWLGMRAGDRLNRRRENSDEVRAACARSLGVMGDRAAVPVLARYLIVPDEKLAFESRKSLHRLFRALNPAGGLHLTAETSENIAYCLSHATAEQAEVFLHELRRTGSPSALEQVRDFARQLPDGPLRELAIQADLALQQRKDAAKNRRTLVRPAEGDSNALLRSSASAPADQSLLLRAPAKDP